MSHSSESKPRSPLSNILEKPITRRGALVALGAGVLAACAPEEKPPVAKPTIEAPAETPVETEPVETEVPTNEFEMPEGAIELYQDEAIAGFEADISLEEFEARARFTPEDIAEGNEEQLAQKTLDIMTFLMNGIRTQEFGTEQRAQFDKDYEFEEAWEIVNANINEAVSERVEAAMRAWGDSDWKVEKEIDEFSRDMVRIGTESTARWILSNDIPYNRAHAKVESGEVPLEDPNQFSEKVAEVAAQEPLFIEDLYHDTLTKLGQNRYFQGPNPSYEIVFDREVTGAKEGMMEHSYISEGQPIDPELLEGQKNGIRIVFDDKLTQERNGGTQPLISGMSWGPGLANMISR